MVVNRQSTVGLDLSALRAYVRRLRRALRLQAGDFNVCLVSDREMERLNAQYRGKPHPTDVLSFPWTAEGRTGRPKRVRLSPPASREFAGFLGDIVISAETARRNARAARHSTAREIRWLVLHGVLHLMGYDHEADSGQMTALELAWRDKLGL